MSILEWGATISSLIYLYFAIKNKPICFVFGIIGSGIWAFVSYEAGLKFDASLQVFYVLISMLGIYRWKTGGHNNTELPITEYTPTKHASIIFSGVIISLVLIYLSSFVESINLPVLDAFTTVFLVIGTLLLIERKLSAWIYLVLADVIYIYIYGVTGLWLFVGMMVIYIVFGISGYFSWKNLMLKANQNP